MCHFPALKCSFCAKKACLRHSFAPVWFLCPLPLYFFLIPSTVPATSHDSFSMFTFCTPRITHGKRLYYGNDNNKIILLRARNHGPRNTWGLLPVERRNFGNGNSRHKNGGLRFFPFFMTFRNNFQSTIIQFTNLEPKNMFL